MLKLRKAFGKRRVESFIVHRAAKTGPEMKTVAPGVEAWTVEDFLKSFP